MLSIGKLAAGPGAGRYYVDQVARGAEDYYAGEGEAPGHWNGHGAEALGLNGHVQEVQIVRLLDGQDPATGEQLRQPVTSKTVAGFDLTFRAPKSVSVLFGIADGAVVTELRAAHGAAVEQALRYLERDACRVRRGAGGEVSYRGEGFVAAAFEHRSSRAGDPLLHTHVVVANAARGPDGRWSALDGRLLYRHAKAAGYLYQAALRAEITERLGLEWGPVFNGVADLKVVPRGVIEHFSQRRGEILEHMDRRGERSARAAQIATLETRRAKRNVPIGRLRQEWCSRAAEHGLTRRHVEWALQRARPRQPRPVRYERIAATLEGPDGLTRERSTFSRRDVLQAFAEAAADGASLANVEALADAFLRRQSVVALAPVAGEQRFSTCELVAVERRAVATAARRVYAGVAIADSTALQAATNARPSLSGEQRELVAALTQSGRGVEVVRAPAGAGKTFALDAAREAWHHGGVPVLGCALSARAASELRDQAAVEATTIAHLARALDLGLELAPGTVLLVDEAAMVGTRALARLSDAVVAADGKLVLVGDDRQLPEIEAGGLFAALADNLGALELREVRRQREPWDREALSALRDGDLDLFVREYEEHGRIVTAPTAAAVRDRLVDDWLGAHSAGERAAMIANRRCDVADLNQRARERLRAGGRLGRDELVTDARAFAVGDRVLARRNARALDVINGDAGYVTEIREGRVAVELDAGRRITLPMAYVRAGHLDHGYALTAHLAQGSTVDRAFVLGSDELYREWGYTALSRHRIEARFYVSASREFLNQAPEPLQPGTAVARMLLASRAERLASEGLGGRAIDPLEHFTRWPERPRALANDRGIER